MEQKKLSITVYNADGDILFKKDPAIPQHFNAVLSLYDDIGNTISIEVSKFELSDSNVSHSGNA